jgi:hypothetical protein
MPRLRLPFVAILFVFAIFTSTARADSKLDDRASTETIELIRRVESSGCVFIRNGDKHSAKEAADHLATKVKRADKKRLSAENFIAKIASKSSQSGDPYWMVFSDGRKVKSGDWLTEQLADIRLNPPAAPPAAVKDDKTSATVKKEKKVKKK